MTARAIALDNLRALTVDELADHLREQRGRLFQVRLQQTIGQVENHRQIRVIRREIARTMTVQVEYRLAAERGEPMPAPAAKPARRGRRVAAVEPAPTPARGRRSRAAAKPVAEEPIPAEPVTEEPVAENAELDAVTDIEVERVDAESSETTGASAAGDEDEEQKK
ncbi:MAG: 50S ribosomal protein L29 [Candidatus Dormibacter sp.]